MDGEVLLSLGPIQVDVVTFAPYKNVLINGMLSGAVVYLEPIVDSTIGSDEVTQQLANTIHSQLHSKFINVTVNDIKRFIINNFQ